ncbi:hypothetical protein IJG96_01945 [Candidatus Saccharibacteria bacterium]|nr:hypothetical protein [Candidatus Saccharibacteria bacterium]
MTDNKDEYFKMKKPVAIGLFVGLGVILAALTTFVVLDTLKIRDIEAKIDTVGDLTQMGPGGKMGGFERGTRPEMDGEAPEGFEGEEMPELPEDKKPSSSSSSTDSSKTGDA